MTQQKANSTSSPPPSRPKGNSPQEWVAYWKAQNRPWRTEPEISLERQTYLIDRRAIVADIEKGIYPFGDIKLDRADIEWLLATHENGRGPIDWSSEQQRDREGLDLRGASLRGDKTNHVDLRNLPLACLRGSLTYLEYLDTPEERRTKAQIHLEGADLSGAYMERSFLSGAHMEGAFLFKAHMEGADLSEAHMEGAFLSGAYMEGVFLFKAHMEGADLRVAHMEGAALSRAHIEGADLSVARMDGADLRDITLSKEDGVGPFFVDVQWGTANLAVVDWSQIVLLGEDHRAQQKNDKDGDRKSREVRLNEYKTAVRANRQLAVVLQSQGLSEDEVRFAYRANALQRNIFWYQMFVAPTRGNVKEAVTQQEKVKRGAATLKRRLRYAGSFLFSYFLDVLAGYGYKPERTLGWYLFVVFSFAVLYAVLGHLAFLPDALVFSLTSFHGRGFLPDLGKELVTLHTPLVDIAACEAVVGLLIELSFIATFTQRFFGK